MMKNDHDSSRSLPPWVFLICLSTLLMGIHGHEPWTPDEPREAEIARAMSAGSSWLIPQLAGRPFVEKPPLYYWVSALMIKTAGKIFGPTTAARTVSALSAALTLLLLWAVAKMYLGRCRARATLLILATMYGFFLAGHWINIDPLLMFLTTAAVLLFFVGVDRENAFFLLGGYAAAGLAFLTKGLVAWVIVLFPGSMTVLLHPQSVRRRLGWHLSGLILLLGPAMVWMAAFYSRGGPELWREWLMDNQFGRFLGLTERLGHIKGPFFYFWVVPVLALPWTPLLFDWIVRAGWKEVRREAPAAAKLIWTILVWAGGGFFILSLSGTKREIYLYPLLPAFALLAGFAVAGASRWVRWLFWLFSVIIFIPLPIFSILSLVWNGERVVIDWGLNLPLLGCTLLGLFSLFRFRENFLPRIAALGSLFYLLLAFSAMPSLDRVWSYEKVARALAKAIPSGRESRVCGWYAGEVERAIFLYYCGITLGDVRDRPRLISILSGHDKQYDYLVVSRLEEEFPVNDPGIPPWQVLARERKGAGRYFYLISGKNLAPPR